ncbi:hypothetical protein DACRYDRAFT_100005 [Dacryopinax primogenitus]|uniref:Uncharacterized protein n=1 Tax=Dacryopinax primogenitus (strain DJM 731) TaxID=1858805 RepID=M5GDH2_DACPD|nr:uncharacterized protein DACRYDRAFT_100005 [Dacryopinax primogenitus]EJU02393.1 hypothetical protein DACRYDRAFT_100005 [Dacryopinax primogenitus]
MTQAAHWWIFYFFLFNLEEDARVGLDREIRERLEQVDMELPLRAWRVGERIVHRSQLASTAYPPNALSSKKRKRKDSDQGSQHENGKDEDESNESPDVSVPRPITGKDLALLCCDEEEDVESDPENDHGQKDAAVRMWRGLIST